MQLSDWIGGRRVKMAWPLRVKIDLKATGVRERSVQDTPVGTELWFECILAPTRTRYWAGARLGCVPLAGENSHKLGDLSILHFPTIGGRGGDPPSLCELWRTGARDYPPSLAVAANDSGVCSIGRSPDMASRLTRLGATRGMRGAGRTHPSVPRLRRVNLRWRGRSENGVVIEAQSRRSIIG